MYVKIESGVVTDVSDEQLDGYTETNFKVRIGYLAVNNGKDGFAPPQKNTPVRPSAVKISPVHLKLMFTQDERVALRALAQTDPKIADMFDILNDQRLTEVDLALTTVSDMVDYALTALEAQGTVTDKAGRKDAVMRGRVA